MISKEETKVAFQKKTEEAGIKNCYREGLKAINKKDRKKIRVSEGGNIDGSVNLDSCLKEQYPTDNRWDYIVGYKGIVFFIEVHSAENIRNIDEIYKKLTWLKNWKSYTPFKNDNRFIWIASGRVNRKIKEIPPHSLHYKKISSVKGPVKIISLDSCI
ncbi:MAG: hypothetical protein GXO18_03285 [Aquificae bacterium]|nr:hypothetical protein [Aquificota bacterium]